MYLAAALAPGVPVLRSLNDSKAWTVCLKSSIRMDWAAASRGKPMKAAARTNHNKSGNHPQCFPDPRISWFSACGYVLRYFIMFTNGDMNFSFSAFYQVLDGKLPCIDLTDGNGKILTIFNLIDPSVTDPNHLVRYIQHFYIMGGGNHGHVSIFTQILE